MDESFVLKLKMSDSIKILKNLYHEIVVSFSPQNILKNFIYYDIKGDVLFVKNKKLNLSGKRVLVFSIGKSGYESGEGIYKILKERIDDGLIITNRDYKMKRLGKLEIKTGSHPLPDKKSLSCGRKIYEKILRTSKEDIIIFLISGGGSDMMVYPENGITLGEYKKTVRILKICGADIGEINTIRKKIDKVKGGKLRILSKSEKFINLLFSDVPGLNDDVIFIASGPVFRDDTTFRDAWQILLKYGIENKVPKSVRNFLKGNIKKGKKQDNKKFEKDITYLLARNRDVVRFAGEYLKRKEYRVIYLKKTIKKEVNHEKEYIMRKIKQYSLYKRTAIIAGGEPTVKIKAENPGKGGRMSHLSLLLLKEFLKERIYNVSFLLAGTDGIDGNSDIAGAIVNAENLKKIKLVEVEKYIKNFNSANFMKKYNFELKPGLTGINLADIMIFIIE